MRQSSMIMCLCRVVFLSVLLLSLPCLAQEGHIGSASSQNISSHVFITPGDLRLDYLRLLQITGDAPFSPLVIQPVLGDLLPAIASTGRWRGHFGAKIVSGASGSARWEVLPIRIAMVNNSDFPVGMNDGVLWTGRGLSTLFDAGVALSYGPLRIQFAPQFHYSRNRPYSIVEIDSAALNGKSEFVNPWHLGRIDLPQRYGTDQLSGFHWGQSMIGVEWKNISLRYGTQNQWWGPARYNPILMSNNAPGFPSITLESIQPFLFLLGKWETRLTWGWLTESDWFDSNTENDKRFLSSILVDWQPSILPNLVVGGGRVYYMYSPEGGLGFTDFMPFFESLLKKPFATDENPWGNDEKDQMLSIFARWVFPESDMEIYGEWARNDHNWDLRDIAGQPDHSRAYTMGIQKHMRGARADYLLGVEITQLGRTLTWVSRATPIYYSHHLVKQGYTHDGQLLGAGIGPGSESQQVDLTRIAEWGSLQLTLSRIRWDSDTYFAQFAPTNLYRGHDVSHSIGLKGTWFTHYFRLESGLLWTWRMNRNFVLNGDAHNLALILHVTTDFN